MYVAIVVPSLANKGPIVVCQNLVLGLIKEKCKVDVLYFDEKFELNIPNCRVININDPKVNLSKYDIIHSHGYRPDRYISNRKKNIKGKIISTLHNYMFQDLRYEYNWLISLIFGAVWLISLRKFDSVIVFTSHMKAYYSMFLNRRKISIVPNGLDFVQSSTIEETILNSILRFKSSFPLVISIGSLNKRKNYKDVIRLSNITPSIRFLIIGDGPEYNFLQKRVSLGKHKNVLLIKGFPDARQCFKFADCHLITSKSEGLPLVFIEACFFSIPTLSSPLPFYREFSPNGESIIFNSKNLEQSKEALIFLLQNSESQKNKAHVLYLKELSRNAMTEKYLLIYNEN